MLSLFEPPKLFNKPELMTIDCYNQFLNGSVKTYAKTPLVCMPQNELEVNYEVEIFEQGNIATRENNWHDFFNLCVWFNFPKTKAVINYLHYSEIKHKKIKNRTSLENAMTLFDENGAVVLSTDKKLLDLIREHQWKTLFWQCRQEILTKMKIIMIGHSLYEKFLSPYIGMTAHTILYEVDDIVIPQAEIDQKVAVDLESLQYPSPRSLQPLPILGVPGWYEANKNPSFYDDEGYFRPKSR